MGETALLDSPAAAPQRHIAPKVPSEKRLLKRVAIACLVIGLLLLAFVAFQLWGTAFYEQHAQGVLRQELKSHLGIVPDNTHHSVSAPVGSGHQGRTAAGKVAPTIAQPGDGQPLGLMSIPRIGMQAAAIVQGTTESDLQQGPGHYAGTPLPGEAGNAAIAGHRTTYAHPFYDLNELQAGDLIYIQTAQGSFVYQVERSEVVSPDDVGVLDSSPISELTLTTCNPRYSAAQRLVVVALLRGVVPAAGTSATSPTSSPPQSPHPGGLAGEATAGPGVIGKVGMALLWGSLALALALLTVFFWRSTWGLKAAAAGTVGALLALAALVMCFQQISLALPSSF
jgi:sortase A